MVCCKRESGGQTSADVTREAICPYRGLDAFREEDAAFSRKMWDLRPRAACLAGDRRPRQPRAPRLHDERVLRACTTAPRHREPAVPRAYRHYQRYH
jgi:hypothetical protein